MSSGRSAHPFFGPFAGPTRPINSYGRPMAIHKVCGIETEYGIVVAGAPDANPIQASSTLVNAYVNTLGQIGRAHV